MHSSEVFSEKFQLKLHDNTSISSQQASASNSISRSTPVARPRVETAHSYYDTDFSRFEEYTLPAYQIGKLTYFLGFYMLSTID